jgi:hypothetical protein
VDAIKNALAVHDLDALVGVICHARGADQVFASVVLELDGTFEVVCPLPTTEKRKVKPNNAADFDTLLERAAKVH